MNRRKRALSIVAVLLALLISLSCRQVYRQYEQARKDQALIEAIKVGDNNRALAMLEQGAHGDARDTGEVPSFRQVFRSFLDWFRHPGTQQKPFRGETALYLSIFLSVVPFDRDPTGPNEPIALALLDHGANPNEAETFDERTGSVSALAFSCDWGKDALVKKLLEKGADPNSCLLGTTSLVCADAKSAKLLIAYGANVNAVDPHGDTALMFAVARSDFEKVRLLLDYGAKVSVKDSSGFTLMTMPYVSHPDRMKIEALLRQYGAR